MNYYCAGIVLICFPFLLSVVAFYENIDFFACPSYLSLHTGHIRRDVFIARDAAWEDNKNIDDEKYHHFITCDIPGKITKNFTLQLLLKN